MSGWYLTIGHDSLIPHPYLLNNYDHIRNYITCEYENTLLNKLRTNQCKLNFNIALQSLSLTISGQNFRLCVNYLLVFTEC
jgi:hypothetical protein